MNKFKIKFNIGSIVILLVISLVLSLAGIASAATSPSLGFSGTYGVLSSSYVNTTNTTINGDVGFTTGPAVAPLGVHVNYGSGVPYATAGIDQGVALSDLAAQICTYTFPAGAVDLATDTTHGTIGVYTPGVYCTNASSAASIGTAGITLNGAGTYIFRINGALTTVNNSNVRLSNGASSCDLFWTPIAATTLGANTTFVGTVIDDSGITVGHATAWNGQALAFKGTVTTDKDIINSVCTMNNPVPIIEETSTSAIIHSSGSSVTYGCKDPNATNYNYFSASNPALCIYSNITSVVAPIPLIIIPKLPKTGFPPKEENTSWLNIMILNILNIFK